ncbi:MAG: Na+/H+ antiporter NhaC family protein, partial [Gemmatimonadetes bacterium]|nr:Na+/H+ antiporter NhaC family protein [Gemmatimonadota bacterium]
MPALVAIVLAILTRQVVPALVAGVLVGAFMMVPCLRADHAFSETNSFLAGIRLAAEHYVLGAIVDTSSGFGHARIMMFTLIIGFAVGVIGRNGGTAGMVKLVAGTTESPRRGALTAWFADFVVFFDDYANTMIVGPT